MTTRILVIDDESTIRALIAAALRDDGYTVDEADGGVTGLDMCEQASFDIVITDLVMPDRDGTSLIIELRKRFPETRVMAVSGVGRTQFVDRLDMASKAGAHAVLAKPFKLVELLRLVHDLERADGRDKRA